VNGIPNTYDILVVDDDPEVIGQLKELLPASIGVNPIVWEFCGGFDEALALLKRRRFDLLVSDIYHGHDRGQKNIARGDARARELVDEIRARRFCPIVLFTDGQLPADLVQRPFVRSAIRENQISETVFLNLFPRGLRRVSPTSPRDYTTNSIDTPVPTCGAFLLRAGKSSSQSTLWILQLWSA
jgi:CheY-like chemotaxis protein